MTDDLLGRDTLLGEITREIERGHHVLVYGPPHIGKTALIQALSGDILRLVAVIDPFEHVTSHAAAEIRRAMDVRDQQFLVAARSLDRSYLGAVRRIAWRFTMIRVTPLSGMATRRILSRAIAHADCLTRGPSRAWLREATQLAAGRPGVALAMVKAAVGDVASGGRWPSPTAAYIAARIHQSGFGGTRAG